MATAVATPIQYKGNTFWYANHTITSVHPSMQPAARYSWAVFPLSPVIRRMETLHPLEPVLSDIHIFEGRLPLSCHKHRPRPRIVVGSSKISPPDSDFAEQEALKFKEGLLKKLAEDEKFANEEAREQVAETCTKVFRRFAMSYSSKLPVEPFVEMRYALEEQGLPLSGVGKVTRAALGWSRYNLYRDWKDWSAAN